MKLVAKIVTLGCGFSSFSCLAATFAYAINTDLANQKVVLELKNNSPWGPDGWEDDLISKEPFSEKVFK